MSFSSKSAGFGAEDGEVEVVTESGILVVRRNSYEDIATFYTV